MAAVGSLQVGPAAAETLYTLESRCSLRGDSQPCIIEAVDVNDTTEYRHRIGERTIVYRISEEPTVRIEGRVDGGAWKSVENAWIRFSANELCFNHGSFCVINPTFLDDVRADGSGSAFQGRETVGLSFGDQGRVEIACFDNGCTRLMEKLGR